MLFEAYLTTKLLTLSSSVYAGYNPDDTYPCIVFDIEDTEPVEVMSQATDFEMKTVNITAFNYDKASTITLANSIRALLDNSSNTEGITVRKVIYRGEQDTYITTNGNNNIENRTVFGKIQEYQFWTNI